jgi:hypothetical protein
MLFDYRSHHNYSVPTFFLLAILQTSLAKGQKQMDANKPLLGVSTAVRAHFAKEVAAAVGLRDGRVAQQLSYAASGSGASATNAGASAAAAAVGQVEGRVAQQLSYAASGSGATATSAGASARVAAIAQLKGAAARQGVEQLIAEVLSGEGGHSASKALFQALQPQVFLKCLVDIAKMGKAPCRFTIVAHYLHVEIVPAPAAMPPGAAERIGAFMWKKLPQWVAVGKEASWSEEKMCGLLRSMVSQRRTAIRQHILSTLGALMFEAGTL